MRILFLAVILALITAPAFAKRAAQVEFSGHELLKMCSSTYDTDYGFCAGYVSAVSNVLLLESVGGFRACNHAPVKSQQAIDIFRSYADIFPESLNGEANIAVAAAIARAFPCQ